MNQSPKSVAFDMAIGFMNDVYSSPNSVNEDRLRRNSSISPTLNDFKKSLFKTQEWIDWFAKVKTDFEIEIPKAIEELNSIKINRILESYNGSPRIQAKIIANVVECEMENGSDKKWRKMLNKVGISSDETPNTRDMFLIACDLLMSSDKIDFNRNNTYNTVMELLGATVVNKTSQHQYRRNFLEIGNKIIDAMCHVLLQVYNGDISNTESNYVSSEYFEDSTMGLTAGRILHHILFEFATSDYNHIPGFKLKFHDSLRSRFTKITASLRLMMCTKNTKSVQVEKIHKILLLYLFCTNNVLKFYSEQNGENSFHNSLEPLLCSLEDMALQNIRTLQRDSTIKKTLLFDEECGRKIMDRNIGYLYELYYFRKNNALGALESVDRVLPTIIDLNCTRPYFLKFFKSKKV